MPLFFLRRLRKRGVLPIRGLGSRNDPERDWFIEHYYEASEKIKNCLAVSGFSLKDKAVADIGCGDGIMALGAARALEPKRIVGFDINPVDSSLLLARAQRFISPQARIPEWLTFRQSAPTRLPAEDGEFDAIYCWSVFEHVADAEGLLREMRRILRPSGPLMLQVWPFYYSADGSHLSPWYPDETFIQFAHGEDEILEKLRSSGAEHMAQEYPRLNKITVDAIGTALTTAGFDVQRLELVTPPVNIPKGLSREHPLSALGIGGVRLVAL